MGFVHPVVIGLSQVDAAGILFFSRAFEICHAAFEAFLSDQGRPLTPAMQDEDWLMPIVHAEVDFAAPSRLGDRMEVHVEVERVGTGSITLQFTLLGSDGLARAMVRHVHAAIDANTFAPRPLPPAVRAWAETP